MSGIGFGTLVHLARQGGYTGEIPGGKTHSIDHAPIRNAGRLLTIKASEIEPVPIDWLVMGSIPLGAMAVIGGQPGLGKSQIGIKLAAAVTSGVGLPDGSTFDNLGSVIILANEDDAARTIRPRLDSAGANPDKVHIVQGLVREGKGDPDLFQLDTDIKDLREEAIRIGDVRLIIIDPPAAYLGSKVDSYKDSDVRKVLTPLGTLAQDTGALVLLIVHLNKRTDGNPQQRIGGSTAWIAAPRVAFMVVEDTKSKARFMLPVKNNLGDDKTGFEYRIQEQLVEYPGQTLKTSHIEWLGSSQKSAAELLDPPKPERASAVDEAKQFLEQELGESPAMVNDIRASAKSAGISWASIQRAKGDLLIIPKKLAAGWQWTLIKGIQNA